MEKLMRIAIVGAGVSGLTVAYLLHNGHDITVFEAGRHAGGHAHTVRIDTADETHQLDTGFLVFNDRNYPNFERLMRRLGVASQPSEMSFSVSDLRGRFEYSSRTLNGLFANRRHVFSGPFYRMIAEVPRFQRAARELLNRNDENLSLREWLANERFSGDFVERLIVPQAAAVWSLDPDQLWSFPAVFLARFFENHGMLGLLGRPKWRTISGGSARYVDALTAGFRDRLRLGSPVDAVTRAGDHVEVKARGMEAERFDHVVIATHADQSLAMLTDATRPEREILGAIPFQHNEVVLHTDRRLLPRRPRAWASWNYHVLERPRARATVTYHLNRLQAFESRDQFCVTLNLTDRIDPSRVLRRIDCEHPVYTRAGVAAQRRISEISADRTHFCGAYWGWGFHEDGVNSALRVARSLGAGP
jgi:predicted NAD/FAD-binding protein